MSKELDKAIKDLVGSKNSKPVNKSRETAWNDFLNKTFPAPAILGDVNTVVNNRVVEGKQIFCIIGKDFQIIEQTESVWDGGELSNEVIELLKKHKFNKNQIDILDKNVEETKLHLYIEFCVDNFRNNFQEESSDEFNEFVKEMEKNIK